MNYNENSTVNFDSVPYLFNDDVEVNSVDLIDCKRQELEFKTGFEIAKLVKNQYEESPKIFLFDGSLIFWHLEAKDLQTKDTFLGKYLSILNQFYKEDLLIAGYISLPKSKELVNLLRVQLCNFDMTNVSQIKVIENLVDAQIVNFYLNKYERTIIFKNHSKIVATYPNHLHPHFFYLDVGSEIARIEVPAWIAKDEAKIKLITQIIIDQSIKGFGYPISLAEAHEQAVIKNADRELFYEIIKKLSVKYKQNFFVSQKSLKKKKIGI